MTLGLEDYVDQRLTDMGVVGYTRAQVTEIAMTAAIEALDTCDTLCEHLGDGSIHDVSDGESGKRSEWSSAAAGPYRDTVLARLAHRIDRDGAAVGGHFEFLDWLQGRFR